MEVKTEQRPEREDWLHLLPEAEAYASRTRLFVQSARPREAFFVESGLLKLVRSGPGGNESIVAVCSSGSWLGVASLIRDLPQAVTAVAVMPCMVRRVEAERFSALLASTPVFARAIEQALSQAVLDQTSRLADLGSLTSRQRCEQALRQLFEAAGTNGRDHSGSFWFELPLKHWELASLIAVSPEHLSRVLRKLRSEGVIRLHKGWIIVRSRELLNGFAAE